MGDLDSSTHYSLPIVVAGSSRRENDPNYIAEFDSRTGAKFSIPRISAKCVEDIMAQDRMLLADLPLQDILAFLNRVGKQWRSPEYPRRRLYVRQMCSLMGYSKGAAEAEADRIAILLNSHVRMHDMIDSDLGSRFIMDDWVIREDCAVRAFPRGMVVHILPGNVPLSGALSIVRNILTKNMCVAKISSNEPLTAATIALSFGDVDKDHPVTRSMNVVYWDHEQDEGKRLVNRADAVVAWGGHGAVHFARENAHDEAPVICFGPKHSLAFVDTTDGVGDAARGLAHDVTIYDQQACFSVRRAFIRGPMEPLIAALRLELDRHTDIFPPGELTIDRAAQIQLGLRLEEFLGADIEIGGTRGWALVINPPSSIITEHQLGRVLYLHQVNSFSDVYPLIDSSVQTVACAPWEVVVEQRDQLARCGVSRVVELGLAHLFRIGGTHDGFNPLQNMVRIVCTEASADVYGKGMVLRLDESRMLEAGTLKDFVL